MPCFLNSFRSVLRCHFLTGTFDFPNWNSYAMHHSLSSNLALYFFLTLIIKRYYITYFFNYFWGKQELCLFLQQLEKFMKNKKYSINMCWMNKFRNLVYGSFSSIASSKLGSSLITSIHIWNSIKEQKEIKISSSLRLKQGFKKHKYKMPIKIFKYLNSY